MILTKAEKLKIKEIAEKHKISEEEAIEIIASPYKFIRHKLKDTDVPNNLTKEEFESSLINFNIPAIGKLYASWAVYKRLNKLK